MSRLLQRPLEHLGLPGVAGLGIFAFVAMLHVSWQRPLQAEIRLAAQQSRPVPTAPAAAGHTAALDALLQQLPDESGLGEHIKALHATALKQGVQLRKGGYDLAWETAGRLGRQRMVFQTNASYPAIRRFLREALAAQPALALDDIAVSQRPTEPAAPEISMTFTLLVARSAPENALAPDQHRSAMQTPVAASNLPLPEKPLLTLSTREVTAGPMVDLFDTPQSLHLSASPREKPVAPPLPFNFVGRYVEGGTAYIFLEQGTRLHTVKAGDIIDDLYRIDRIDQDVHMTYLPLKERQTLVIGDLQ